MRQRQVRQAQRLVGRGLDLRIQAIGAADDEGDVAAIAHPELQPLGELYGGERRAALVEHDAAHTLGQSGLDARRFRSHQLLGRLAIARLGLQRLQFEPALRRKTLGEIGIGRVGPGRLP